MAAFQNDEPSRVGASFVTDYYQQLTADPAGLIKYYNKETQFSHSQSDEQELSIHVGIAEISAKIEALGLQDVKTHLYSVKCQSTVNGAVLVIVNGLLSNNGQPPQTFNQTFVLAKSQRKQKAYYVLNDVLVFVPSAPPADDIQEDEEEYHGEEEEAAEAEAEEEPVQSQAPAQPVESWADEQDEEPASPDAQAEPEPAQHVEEEEPEEAAEEPQAPEPQPTPAAAPQQPAQPAQAQTPPPAAKSQEATSSKGASFADVLKHGNKAPEQKQRKTGGWPQRVTNAAPPAATPAPHGTQPHGGAQNHGTHAPKRTSTGPQNANNNNNTDAPKRPRALPQSQTRPSVYVAKVPENASDEEIREAFTAYGNVTSVRNRPAKRIAFVDFATTEAQAAAVEAAANNLVLIRGKALVVQPQRREPEQGEQPSGGNTQQPAGGRGRGRGRGRDHVHTGGRGNNNNRDNREQQQQKASA